MQDVKWRPVFLWQSEPDGLAIVADAIAVRVETPRQLLVTMQLHRPDQYALVDQAVCSQLGKAGPETYALSLEAAKQWAANMRLNINAPRMAGSLPIGEVLSRAWEEHQRLWREARAASALGVG